MRNALKAGDDSPRLILVEVGEYWLDAARFMIDVDEFNLAIAKARSATHDEVAAEWYERAAALYQGEYLQNLYYEWVFPKRRRLTQLYLHALQELSAYHLSIRSYTQAIEYLEKAIPLDMLNEDLYRLSMQAYAGIGDRSGVARMYAQLKQALNAELNALPLPETTSLYRELTKKHRSAS